MATRPTVLVFDVNETLLELESMAPLFTRVFGDPMALRQWFNQLVLYSMTVTLSGCYTDFFTLSKSVLQMLADVHGVSLTGDDRDAIAQGMRTMPAHPDVEEGLKALADQGFRLVTLTNSPVRTDASSPLDNAGLGDYFERQFSVHTLRAFKPATALYTNVADELSVEPSECMMVAAHAWDIIGAQSAGYAGALITRPGNAPLRADGVPEPTVLARDIRDLAARLSGATRG